MFPTGARDTLKRDRPKTDAPAEVNMLPVKASPPFNSRPEPLWNAEVPLFRTPVTNDIVPLSFAQSVPPPPQARRQTPPSPIVSSQTCH